MASPSAARRRQVRGERGGGPRGGWPERRDLVFTVCARRLFRCPLPAGVTGSATDTNVGGGVKQGISTGPPLKGYEGDVRGEGRQLGAAAGSSNAGGLGSVGAIPTSGGTSGVSGGGEDFSTATIPQRGTTATGEIARKRALAAQSPRLRGRGRAASTRMTAGDATATTTNSCRDHGIVHRRDQWQGERGAGSPQRRAAGGVHGRHAGPTPRAGREYSGRPGRPRPQAVMMVTGCSARSPPARRAAVPQGRPVAGGIAIIA